MKEEFFNSLEKKIKEENLDLKIIEKYKSWYEIGLNAGMSEEEILLKFGSVDEIIKKEMEEDKRIKDSFEIDLIDLNIPSIDDLSIEFVEGSEISYLIDSELEKYIEVKKTDKTFSISAKNQSKFGRNFHHGDIYIKIGKNLLINNFNLKTSTTDTEILGDISIKEFHISNNSGDFNMKGLIKGETLKINNISGDLLFDELNFKDISIKNVSGDVSAKNITSNVLNCENVSGDFKLNLNVNNLTIDTVSGDFKLFGKALSYKCHTVSGDVILNEEKINKNIKDLFSTVIKRSM
jgi:DUF4097 and DUF4098 domain-containing protein YvlB